MGNTKYTYAVARIRALEVALFSDAVIEQLLSCKTAAEALQFVVEKGWGDMADQDDPDVVLRREEEKTWEVIKEVAPDASVFNVLSYPKLYHNLKAAIKEVCTEARNPNIFYDDCPIPGEEMLRIVENREFSRLPSHMGNVAQEALETLLHTRDGQLCDIMIDKAALEAIRKAGKESGEPIIENYADTMVAIADIKIAVRSQKTAKTIEFMKRAMAPCKSLNVERLAKAACSSMEAIVDYLAGTVYAEGAAAIAESSSAFERWCDNRMMRTMQPQKYESFSVGPLVAYLLARENEIKTVRIILSGKQNGFSEEAIRERVREMYV